MVAVTIKQGECFASLCKEQGFHDPAVLHQSPANANLKRTRPNPHILVAGDTVQIPDKQQKTESLTLEQHKRFTVLGLVTEFSLILEDFEGQAFANKHYVLDVAGHKQQGQLDASGKLTEKIDASALHAELTVYLDDAQKNTLFWVLELGALPPLGMHAGVQARLNNLGYFCANETGNVEDTTKAAIRAFKAKNGLPVSDIADSRFKTVLMGQHGC